jgi:hypothetical protein
MLARLGALVLSEIERHESLLASIDIVDRRELLKSPELVDAAKRHCLLYAAAAALHVWWANRGRFSGASGAFFDDGQWLALCLHRWIEQLHPGRAERVPRAFRARAAAELQRRYEEDEMYSVVPLQLARRSGA